jgi:hypothetical protein
MSQQVSREQIREVVARVVGQFESRLAAGVTAATQTQAAQPPSAPPAYFAPWTGAAYQPSHPSQQQFSLADAGEPAAAAADVLQFAAAAPCTIEKGKPCDQCGACRVLGF